jgi:hypothetical protein
MEVFDARESKALFYAIEGRQNMHEKSSKDFPNLKFEALPTA